MAKEKVSNDKKDILGNDLAIGDCVAVADNCLKICIIDDITPKMVRVKPVAAARGWRSEKGMLKYSTDMVKIDGEMATFYVLKYT
jgi:hypothetical protein